MQEELLKEVKFATGLKMNQHRDFVALSEIIFNKTHETISPTTLKRLWGVVTDQQCNPSMHTLDLIAEAISYKSYKLFADNVNDVTKKVNTKVNYSLAQGAMPKI